MSSRDPPCSLMLIPAFLATVLCRLINPYPWPPLSTLPKKQIFLNFDTRILKKRGKHVFRRVRHLEPKSWKIWNPISNLRNTCILIRYLRVSNQAQNPSWDFGILELEICWNRHETSNFCELLCNYSGAQLSISCDECLENPDSLCS